MAGVQVVGSGWRELTDTIITRNVAVPMVLNNLWDKHNSPSIPNYIFLVKELDHLFLMVRTRTHAAISPTKLWVSCQIWIIVAFYFWLPVVPADRCNSQPFRLITRSLIQTCFFNNQQNFLVDYSDDKTYFLALSLEYTDSCQYMSFVDFISIYTPL